MNLSPRWKPLQSTTSDKLAPNHYNLGSYPLLKNRAPFLSNAERHTVPNKHLYTDALYDPCIEERIIGGSSLRCTSKRESFNIVEGPGPADYDPKYIPKKTPKVHVEPVKGKRLYVCSVPYNLAAVGPSIPTVLDENGYYINVAGKLVKNPPNYHDRTVGPAYYNVPTQPCLTTRLYKGCEWWKSRSRRGSSDETVAPAPGTYSVKVENPFNERDEYVREMARLCTFLPRYLEMQQRRLKRDNFPGPGSYEITTKHKQRNLSLVPVPFCSSKDRFSDKVATTPVCTKYNTSHSLIKRNISKADVPFNIKTSRFSTRKLQKAPGPGQYDIPSQLEEKTARKSTVTPDVIPPFNQTGNRELLYVTKEMCSHPGPQTYEVTRVIQEKSKCDASVFRSKTDRLKPRKYMKSADPASYSVCEPFNKNRNAKSHNVAKVAFLSKVLRGSELKPSSYFNPGPVYLGHEPISSKGYYFDKAPITYISNDNPGPATYCISSSGDAMYKAFGTHNLRLKENVFHTKLRVAPGNTRNAWCKELKKHKQLRVFYRPPTKIASWITTAD